MYFICIFRAVGYMMFTLFWPIVPYIIQVVFALYWGASALYPLLDLFHYSNAASVYIHL